MKIAILQYPFFSEAEKTFQRLLSLYQRASGVDLVVAPELGISGFEEALNFDFLKQAFPQLEKASQKLPPLLVGGASRERKSAVWLFQKGKKHEVAQKINLFPGFDAEKGFLPGEQKYPFPLGEIFLGALVCFDLRFPEITKFLATRGAKAIFVLAAWPEERTPHFKALLKARAIENQVFVVGVNASGEVAGIKLGGNSIIFDPWGEEVFLTAEEGIFTVELDLKRLQRAKRLFITTRKSPPLPPEQKILPLEELLPLLQAAREAGERIVFTNGCFDILHAGHVKYLQAARKEGDLLVVGLNSDRSVRRIKGPARPVNPENLRAQVLAGLSVVDFVTIFEEDTPERLIRAIRPEVLVKGADWPEEKIVGAPFVKSYGGRVVRVPFEVDISTSRIIERIKK